LEYFKSTWLKVGLWPALGWTLTAISGGLIWLVVPHKLATWAMPVTGRPVLPTWKWLAGIVTLYGFLGCTCRALVAWVRRHNDTLYAANFANRPAVIERTTYCDLGHEADIAAFTTSTLGRKPTLWWIVGAGGGGKTALSLSSCHLKKHCLINSLGLQVNESVEIIPVAYKLLPYKISPVLLGSLPRTDKSPPAF
jgi:hypothetical protein